MTREEAAELLNKDVVYKYFPEDLLKIIRAYADGKIIEVRRESWNGWIWEVFSKEQGMAFNLDAERYRIKETVKVITTEITKCSECPHVRRENFFGRLEYICTRVHTHEGLACIYEQTEDDIIPTWCPLDNKDN